jgi:hypothetical protein
MAGVKGKSNCPFWFETVEGDTICQERGSLKMIRFGIE